MLRRSDALKQIVQATWNSKDFNYLEYVLAIY